MTLFSEPNENQATATDQLVGEGRKFTDVEALAKGKLEADNHVSSLEQQIKELREDLTGQNYAKEILAKLEDKAPAVAPGIPQAPVVTTPADDTKSGLSEEEISRLVDTTLSTRQKEAVVRSNLETVDKSLTESYGTEADAKVMAKATELGMSVEALKALAGNSPKAFFAIIGEPMKITQPVVHGSVNTSGVVFEPSTKRNKSYYQKLRREDSAKYFSPNIQRQLIQDRVALGEEEFYK